MNRSDLPKSALPGNEARLGADPWVGLRRYTPARIALGRTGGSQPTAAVLDFRLAHARARDAVHADFQPSRLTAALQTAGIDSVVLASAAPDKRAFLLRPDLGRKLNPVSETRVREVANRTPDGFDLTIIVSDGLAAAAAERHAVTTVLPLIARLQQERWRIGPVFVVPLARVKLQDEIGSMMRSSFSLMLLGERPGLSAPDSLGAYFTANPHPDRTDADRNCVSNIRPEGIPPQAASDKLGWMLLESRRTGLCGVHLKDNQPSVALD